MFLSGREHFLLQRCFAVLNEELQEQAMREQLGPVLLDLLRADQLASYAWDGGQRRFVNRVAINMEDANLERYESWFMFRDPITFELQKRRHATLVSEVMPRRALLKSEFFNDFLARDGLHWGINLHAFDGASPLADLRVWRARHRKEFEPRDKQLLDLLEPAFVGAMRRGQERAGRESFLRRQHETSQAADAGITGRLSARELQVARCVARGLTDKQIARELEISLSSVRTYLRRLSDKLGVRRRGALAHLAGCR